jgi:GT2 family glycosyltransferase
MTARFSVTVGIPTYSRFGYLKQAITSTLAQSYPELEILISQNPHQDSRVREEIADYCRAIAERDSRVRYEFHDQNMGQTGNFRWLVDHAQGDYIILIGDDDRLLPNAINDLVRGLDSDVAVAFGRRKIIDDEGRVQPRCVPPPRPDIGFFLGWPFSQYEVPAGRLADPELWAWRQAMGVETSLVRVRDFRCVGYRELDMPDLEFFIFLAREGGDFVFVPEYVTEYRFHPNSSTSRGFHDYRPLFDDLERLSVGSKIEAYKREVLEVMAFRAISKCLLVGEVDHARRLLENRYYPAPIRTGVKGRVIKFCAQLPGTLGPRAYNALYALKNGRSYRIATA